MAVVDLTSGRAGDDHSRGAVLKALVKPVLPGCDQRESSLGGELQERLGVRM